MAENTEPAADADGKSSSDGNSSAPRRVFGAHRRATPTPEDRRPDLEEKLADLVDSVKGLQSHLSGSGPTGDTPPATTEARTRGAKRFQRRGGEEPAPLPEARTAALDHEVRGNEATLNQNIAWPRLARLEPAPTSLGERGVAYLQRHPSIVWVVVQAVGLGLILLGYWAGSSLSGDEEEQVARNEERSSAPGRRPAGDLLARVGVNDRAMAAANAALRGEKTGDYRIAQETYEAAAAGRLRLPGAEYRLAMLDIERQDFAAADIHLNNSLTAGEMVANCYFINACSAARKADFAEAARQLRLASRIEPFNAKYLFCHGEALRRAGKTQEAIEALGLALDRPLSPSDFELVEFKLRLAKVEVGQDQTFNQELADHLAKTPVGGDWLLLAAAQDLTRAAYPAAAGHLAEAAKLLSPQAYGVLVQDYLFQGHAGRPELTPVLRVPRPPSSDKPIDPGVWPYSEADPATWPPFSPAL